MAWRHGEEVVVQLHSFVTRSSWVVRFTSQPLSPHRRNPCYPLKRLAGFKSWSQRFEKSLSLPVIETWFFGCPHPSLAPNSSISKDSLNAIQTTSRLKQLDRIGYKSCIPNFIAISTVSYVMILWDMTKGINLYFCTTAHLNSGLKWLTIVFSGAYFLAVWKFGVIFTTYLQKE